MSQKFFIEIGVSNFQTLQPLLSNGWSGLMVEPVEDTFNEIPSHSNLTKEKCAIDTKDGYADFWVVENPNIFANAQDVIGMSALADSPSALHDEVYQNRLKTIKVPTMRMETLLAKYRVKYIDLLKIDIEGKDVDVLLDYSFRIKPKMIKFEHIHCSGKAYDASIVGFDQVEMTKKYHTLLDKLRNLGYIVWEENEDVYCIL
jgi:FkbM family methyltransferase